MKTAEIAEKTKTEEIGKKALEACASALDFLSRDGGELNPLARPVIKALREAKFELESGVIAVEQPAKDVADIQYDSRNPENPRVVCNIPAGTGFWHLQPEDTSTNTPAFIVVTARPDRQEMALGCLAAAAHATNVYKDMKDISRLRLTHGVPPAMGEMAKA